ncbi:MAG: glycosyltransferase family 2 protein [Candidatus Tenebribacter burtonii]|jgi:glycosyltransferase involved in cell wall biosynthesis|nr:glycosyltransferase family 2 protein [Candidatus Tenebribacter burtonii]
MKISIITPTYNQGFFIEETIKSIIYQTGDFELEYIIIDGASTDQTLKVIKHYDKIINSPNFMPNCTRLTFKWISEKDSGQSEAINKGFRMTTGEIVNWINSDDILYPNAIYKIVNAFQSNPKEMLIFGDCLKLDENGNELMIFQGRKFSRRDLIRCWDRIYVSFYMIQPSCFFRKSLLDEFGFFNEESYYCMDYEWYLKVNVKYDFYYINKMISGAKFHKKSKSCKYLGEDYKASIIISKGYWKENYLYYASSYYINLFMRLLWKTSLIFRNKFPFYSKVLDRIKDLL